MRAHATRKTPPAREPGPCVATGSTRGSRRALGALDDAVFEQTKRELAAEERVGGGRHAYDLGADPGERDPGALAEGARNELAAALDRHVGRMPATVERKEIPMDDATRSELSTLGYLE